MTIDALEKKLVEDEARRKALREQAQELQAQAKQIKKQMEAAADEANIGEYMRLRKELEAAEAAAFVAQRGADNSKPEYTEEDVKSAWADYVKQYSKTFEKRSKELQEAKEALCKAFDDLVYEQQQAQKMRERIGLMLRRELPPSNASPDYLLRDLAQMPTYKPVPVTPASAVGVVPSDATINYVIACRKYHIHDSEVQRYDRVIRLHRG